MNDLATDLTSTLLRLDERVQCARQARLVLMDRVLQLVGRSGVESSSDGVTLAELRRWLEDLSEAERAAVDVPEEAFQGEQEEMAPLVTHLRAQIAGQARHLRVIRAEEGRLVDLFLKIASSHVPLGAR